MFQILIAEDDVHQARLMQSVLRQDGYEVCCAPNGKAALEVLERRHIDLLVLDVMMPEMDGLELARTLRDSGDTRPILMVTARQMPEDKIRGFASGTDDYMTKPVEEEELLWRIRALLRRAMIVSDHRLTVGQLTLDYDALTATRNGRSETLPQKEFQLLFKLLSNPNRIYTRLQLMDEIWGMDSESADTTVNVHVNRLRKRFAACTDFEIVAVRGVGYKAVVRNA